MQCLGRRVGILLLPLAWLATAVRAQPTPQASRPVEGGPIPVVTGVMSYQSNFSPGTVDVNPEFDPILLLPFGEKVLIESEFSMSIDLTRDHGQWGPAV